MKKTNNSSSRWLPILLWIVILWWAIYYGNYWMAFAKYKNKNYTTTNSNTPSNYSTPKGGWCWDNGWWCRFCGWAIAKSTTPIDNTVNENITYEIVNVWHDEYSMIPETLTLNAGKNYKLIITPSADWWGCMNNMTIPKIDENIYDIKKWVPITIIINNAKAGKYEVVCANMWMHQWRINIQ